MTAGPSTPAPHSILLALVAPVIPLTALKVGDRGGTTPLPGLDEVRPGWDMTRWRSRTGVSCMLDADEEVSACALEVDEALDRVSHAIAA